jgi:hypothetical protein
MAHIDTIFRLLPSTRQRVWQQLEYLKILGFICPVENNNWRNISTIYIHITKQASNEIHGEVGRAKDLSAFPEFVTN